ncbi:MAG TPA: hypothetical protein VD713_00775, partial [Sphingomonadales bacterium]|nr:hypothetical protein [Sphingomonadales bacterium]
MAAPRVLTAGQLDTIARIMRLVLGFFFLSGAYLASAELRAAPPDAAGLMSALGIEGRTAGFLTGLLFEGTTGSVVTPERVLSAVISVQAVAGAA